jgi:cell division protein FtsL
MTSVRGYKVALLALVVIVIAVSAVATYYYQQQGNQVLRAADLNTQVDSYKAQINDLNNQKSNLNNQIASLNEQISQDNLQIQQLKTWLSGNSSANAQLRVWLNGNVTEVQRLQSTVSQLTQTLTQITMILAQTSAKLAILEIANLKGTFTFSNDCPFLSNCSYKMDGAYANIGNTTAVSASVTFTFYSGTSGTGQVLCTTMNVLGDVPAQSVATMTEVSCAGNSSTQAKSARYAFNWT